MPEKGQAKCKLLNRVVGLRSSHHEDHKLVDRLYDTHVPGLLAGNHSGRDNRGVGFYFWGRSMITTQPWEGSTVPMLFGAVPSPRKSLRYQTPNTTPLSLRKTPWREWIDH